MVRHLLLISVLLVACEPPDVRGSFAFISIPDGDGQWMIGSAFMSDSGYIVTAAHVVDDREWVYLKNMDGEETIGNVVHFDSQADIAYLEAEEDIWGDSLEVAGIDESAGTFRGCFTGRKTDTSVTTICSMAEVIDGFVTFFGKSAKRGMSGGPCFKGDVVVGVLSSATGPIWGDPDVIETPGVTYCDTFERSWDYFFGF